MRTIFDAFTTVSTQHIPQWFIKINSELSMIWYWDFTLPNVKFIYGICQNELHFRFRLFQNYFHCFIKPMIRYRSTLKSGAHSSWSFHPNSE